MSGQQNQLEHIWFLKIAIIVGVILTFIVPPMSTPDENAHYMNAYSISKGDFFPEIMDGQIGRYVSTIVLNFKNEYTGKYGGSFNLDYSFGEAYFDSWLPNSDDSETFYSTSLTAISPVGYLVSGTGMAIGAHIGNLFEPEVNKLPYNLMLYGRFANLIYYIAVIYWAIKITPYLKKTMLIISLMPMSIYLGASLNYDAVLLPTTILLVAVILRLLDDAYEKVRRTDIGMVLLCTFVLVGIKQVYAPLLLLLLAVPKKKYGRQKEMCICIALVVLTAIFAYMPTAIINVIKSGAINENESLIMEQQAYIRGNWFRLPEIIINSFRQFRGFYLESFWGKLGQLDTNFPVPFLAVFYVVLLLVAACECSAMNIWSAGWKRFLPVLGICISLFGMFFAMYQDWTPLVVGVGAEYVSGVQGRYFIPLFLPLLLCMSNGLLQRFAVQKHIVGISTNIAKGCAAVCGAITIIIVYARYW